MKTPTSSPVAPTHVADIVDDGTAPNPAGAVAASAAFAWRGLLKIRHVPEQLVDATIGPVLLLVSFTYLFGGAIDGSPGAYLQFVLPGVLVMAVLLTTPYAGIALAADRGRGVIDRFRSLPVWTGAPLVGGVAGDAVRSTLAATTVVAVGLVLGFDADGGVAGLLAGVALVVIFAFAVSWILTACALALRSESAVQGTGMTGVFLLVFLSNVFVDPATLPAALETVVGLNPISHLTTAVRGLLSGTSEAGDVVLVLVEAAAITALFAPLTWRGYRAS
ncbi:ABC transporter permease [Conexibacter arvalis]|uniref:Transport permease protein n=1 Tax=Conexibacter arvalis TaxID=912552 RepID=A0A840IIS7_9ACTN|nr:ABC transporter permease [Conexibacter arvalis]MBB4663914.1 ABC-2 type transport system permease protein [Conexibacter arvalis]